MTVRNHDAWRTRAVVAWALIGIAICVVLGIRGLMIVGPAVELLLIGCIVGFICSPITNALEDRGMPRAGAAFVALLVVIGVLVALLAAFSVPLITQTIAVLRSVPGYIGKAQDALATFWSTFGTSQSAQVQWQVDQLVQSLSNMGTDLASQAARQLSTNLVSNAMGTFDNLVNFFLGLVLAYWLAKDYPKIVHEIAVISGPRHAEEVTLMFAVMSRSMGGYMRGQLITSVANAAIVFVGLAIMGHPYATLVAMATFLLHFIPVIGPFMSAFFAVLLALFVSPAMAFWTMLLMVVAANVADNVLSPLVMRSAVKVHPALTLVGIVIGGSLAGAAGMLLAIPLTAAIRSLFVYYFEEHTGRQLVSEEGALFCSTPYRDEEGRIQPSFDALDDDKFFENTRLVSEESFAPACADDLRSDATADDAGATTAVDSHEEHANNES